MRSIHVLSLSVLLGLGAMPAAAQKVQIDYDKTVDFSKYETFAWDETAGTSLAEASPLMHSRLKNAIEDEFGKAGITEVEPGENPDFYITYHTNTKDQVRYNTVDYGYRRGPGWYWGGGFGNSATSAYTYSKGTLVIDIWDAHTENLVWRGVSTATVPEKPEKAARLIDSSVSKLAKRWRKMYQGPTK